MLENYMNISPKLLIKIGDCYILKVFKKFHFITVISKFVLSKCELILKWKVLYSF